MLRSYMAFGSLWRLFTKSKVRRSLANANGRGRIYYIEYIVEEARQGMKKTITAFLLFDLIAGMLFLGVYGLRSQAVATDSGVVRMMEGGGGMPEDVRKIAITFDDGPHPYYTEQLLDGLKERGVVATFFVTGEHAKLHPDIIKRMQEDA